MNEIPLKNLNANLFLQKGVYEGFEYYKLVAKTPLGINCSKKLSAFEYNTLLEKYGKNA